MESETPKPRRNIDFDRLAMIIEMATAIASEDLDLSRIIDTIAENAKRLLGADLGVVALLDDDAIVISGASAGWDLKNARIDLSASLSGIALKSGEIVVCHDTQTDERIDQAFYHHLGLRSAISVPLSFDGRPFGVTNVLWHRPNAASEGDIQTLQLIAGLLSATVARAAEYQARHESEERYRATIDSLDEGVVNYGASGAVYSSNASAQKLLGLTRDQIAFPELRPAGWHAVKENGEDFPEDEWPIAVSLRTGEPVSKVTMGIVTKAGSPTAWLTVNARPFLRGKDGAPKEAVMFFAPSVDKLPLQRQR